MEDDPREITEMDRFLGKFSVGDACWEWGGCLDAHGYGVAWILGKRWLAHRAAYVLLVGPLPAWMCVLHHCDNPRCVKPSHLFLGSQADNMRDMKSKGRSQHHGRGGTSRLSARDVSEIRRRLRGGERAASLGREFSVHRNTVHNIKIGRTWRDIQ